MQKERHTLIKVIHWIFNGFIGQRILLFLAPFLMPATAFQPKNTLFAHFYIPYLAPTIGIVFLYSAFLVMLNSLKQHGIDFTWLIHIESWSTKIKFFFSLLVLIHAAALSRFLAPYLLQIFKHRDMLALPPLTFWFSYYGGVAMVIGSFAWIIVLLAGLQLSWLGLCVAFAIIIGLIVFARLELRRRQFELYEELSNQESTVHHRLTLILFIVLAALGLSLVVLL